MAKKGFGDDAASLGLQAGEDVNRMPQACDAINWPTGHRCTDLNQEIKMIGVIDFSGGWIIQLLAIFGLWAIGFLIVLAIVAGGSKGENND